jgi:hypothetical protein
MLTDILVNGSHDRGSEKECIINNTTKIRFPDIRQRNDESRKGKYYRLLAATKHCKIIMSIKLS